MGSGRDDQPTAPLLALVGAVAGCRPPDAWQVINMERANRVACATRAHQLSCVVTVRPLPPLAGMDRCSAEEWWTQATLRCLF